MKDVYTVSQNNCATFIFTLTLANVGRFLKFFQCRNQKEMAHNKNEKFPTDSDSDIERILKIDQHLPKLQ